MAVSYPSGLPIPLVASYSNVDLEKYLRNNTKLGKIDYALLTENRPVEFKVNWFFTDLEFQVFDGFFNHELTFGSKAFNINLKVGGGLKSHEVYFNKNYISKLLGKRWRVSGNLIGLQKQYDDLTTYNSLSANQTLAISTPSQIGLLLDANSSLINTPANSWICITLDPPAISSFNNLINLVDGDNINVELWEKVGSVDGLVSATNNQTAAATITTLSLNGGATSVYFVLGNTTSDDQLIQILVPS